MARQSMIMKKRVTIDHPLWDRLRELDTVAAKRFPHEYESRGFGCLGLMLHPKPLHYEYWCTPRNALTFATTGGNGVHFSFIVIAGEVTEQSPILITIPMAFEHPNFIVGSWARPSWTGTRSPMAFEHPNFIVGEGLFDFLSLGTQRGYFALEQLPAREKTLEVYNSPAWEPTEDSDWAVGYGLNEHQQEVLGFLSGELGLMPWKDLKRKFDRLQKQLLPLLEMPGPDE